jgi:hypothetical protein
MATTEGLFTATTLIAQWWLVIDLDALSRMRNDDPTLPVWLGFRVPSLAGAAALVTTGSRKCAMLMKVSTAAASGHYCFFDQGWLWFLSAHKTAIDGSPAITGKITHDHSQGAST